MNYKNDFPILKNNPDLVYFDSTASSQKPAYVIDGIKEYLETNYSNIHRWMYDIAINSEKLYNDSKKMVAKHVWVSDEKEIIYTYNATYALNLLTSSLKRSNFLQKWDKVLLSIVEHHANVVPWLILKEEIWIEVDFVNVTKEYDIDREDFEKKYDATVKVISFTQVSNVTGQIFDLEAIWKQKREETIFIVDGSQSVPHFKIDVEQIGADFLFFTGHKVFADSGIWVLWGKRKYLEMLQPSFSWGWSIFKVHCEGFSNAGIPNKFEPWTPNMTWAVSLLKSFEYIEQIWWFEKIEKIENKLNSYFLKKLEKYPSIQLIWNKNSNSRVWVFSLVFEWYHAHDIAEILAKNNIAVRAGKHCAHPFFTKVWISNTLRVSFYIYNDFFDIDNFFEVLKKEKVI